jgi:hypothetical protein
MTTFCHEDFDMCDVSSHDSEHPTLSPTHEDPNWPSVSLDDKWQWPNVPPADGSWEEQQGVVVQNADEEEEEKEYPPWSAEGVSEEEKREWEEHEWNIRDRYQDYLEDMARNAEYHSKEYEHYAGKLEGEAEYLDEETETDIPELVEPAEPKALGNEEEYGNGEGTVDPFDQSGEAQAPCSEEGIPEEKKGEREQAYFDEMYRKAEYHRIEYEYYASKLEEGGEYFYEEELPQTEETDSADPADPADPIDAMFHSIFDNETEYGNGEDAVDPFDQPGENWSAVSPAYGSWEEQQEVAQNVDLEEEEEKEYVPWNDEFDPIPELCAALHGRVASLEQLFTDLQSTTDDRIDFVEGHVSLLEYKAKYLDGSICRIDLQLSQMNLDVRRLDQNLTTAAELQAKRLEALETAVSNLKLSEVPAKIAAKAEYDAQKLKEDYSGALKSLREENRVALKEKNAIESKMQGLKKGHQEKLDSIQGANRNLVKKNAVLDAAKKKTEACAIVLLWAVAVLILTNVLTVVFR